MNAEEIIKDLRVRYSGKKIFILPEENPTKVICEIERSDDDRKSVAIAIIDKSEPHKHEKTTEEYVVKEGRLILHVGNELFVLEKGESHTVHPEEVHFAKGEATEVEVTCVPAWTPEDHILVELD